MADAGITDFRRRSVLCASQAGLHRMAYVEWGDPRNRNVLVCVHGLTRSGRDFDDLARALCAQYRVVCPDIAGRGHSDRLPDPALYVVPQYVADMVTLIARLDVEAIDWVGTSLGGLIGMALAAQARTPVRKLVLNDAGPQVARASLERIATYLGRAPDFASLEQAEQYVRGIAASFGPHTDRQWRFLTETWVRKSDDGTYRAHYDPRIAEAFLAAMPEKNDLELWPLYEAVRCPTLALRGEHSDLLTREAHQRMASTGPRARLVEFPGVGHAPTLMSAEQIAPVRDFLLEPEGEAP